ncbi:MAG: VacJ family lipoprotein [Hyphomicrobiales bacterium]|nr:VacJ family lipoprotein [Hyphomicrobiales bacterium]MCP5371202.1 VacJ family lipoprotein [Hyphomicrobiales bacterium]
MTKILRGWRAGLPALVIAGLACTAAVAADADADKAADGDKPAVQETSDPLEPINRVTSSVNRALRALILNPAVELYKGFTPPPAQEAIGNTARNLTEPVTAVSSVFQGDNKNAEIAMERFFINLTEGLGGTRDVATEKGVVGRREDFGQVLGANGVGGGAHIVLPVLGPTNTRDAAGDVVNFLINPLYPAHSVDNAITYANNKDEIEALSRNALDPYVAEREAYEQHRRYQIENGEVKQDGPTFGKD